MDSLIDMYEDLSYALAAQGLPDDAHILEFRSRSIEPGELRNALSDAVAAVLLRLDSADEEPFWPYWPAAFDLGFVPVACGPAGDLFLRSSLVTDVSRLGGRTRGLVTMSSLGANGRFANQIFQHAFITFYGLRHGCAVALPEWDGTEIYGARNRIVNAPLPGAIRFFAFDNDDTDLWKLETPPTEADFWGYFQELPECWGPHRELFRRIYNLREPQAGDLAQRVEVLTQAGMRPLVAIHVRRGDYVELHKNGLPWYRPVPEAWYTAWLDGVFEEHPDAVLYVATDAPELILPTFARFRPMSLSEVESVSGLPPATLDFEIMRRADRLAVCNSSFSRMAAILATDSQHSVIADFDRHRFAPFEPWSPEPFWQRFEGTGLPKQSPMMGYDDHAKRLRAIELRRQAATGIKAYDDLTRLWAEHGELSERYQRSEEQREHLLARIDRMAADSAALAELSRLAGQEAAQLRISLRSELLRRPGRIPHRVLFLSLLQATRVARRLLGPKSGFAAAYLTPMIESLREYRHREALRMGRAAIGSILRRFSKPMRPGAPGRPPAKVRTERWHEPGQVPRVDVTRPFEILRLDGTDLAEQIEQSNGEVLMICPDGAEGLAAEQRLAAAVVLAEPTIDLLVCGALARSEALLIRRSAILSALPANRRLKRGLALETWMAHLRACQLSAYSCPWPREDAGDSTTPTLGHRHPIWQTDPIGGAQRLEAALLRLPRSAPGDARPHCLVIVPWLPMGGSEVVMLDVMSRLAEDWRLSIVTTLPSGHAMRAQFAAFASDILHAGDLLDQDRIVAVIAATLQLESSRAILTSNAALAYERAPELKARFRQLAILDIIHNDLPEGHIRNAIRFSAAFTKHIAISARNRASLIARGVPAARVQMIPNGIDIEAFQPAAERSELKAAWGASESDILLGFVGRLSGEKRPDRFLDVVTLLAAKLPIRAVIVGEGGELADLEARIARESLPVRIVPKLDRGCLPRVYSAFDVLVITSSIEGMPLVMLEALACGTPVASTRVGDVERIIREGVNGFLAPVDFVEQLAEAILRAVRAGELGAMRGRARESIVASGMTRQVMLDGYATVMSDSLQERPAAD